MKHYLKKALALLLGGVLMIGMITACGQTSAGPSGSNDAGGSGGSETSGQQPSGGAPDTPLESAKPGDITYPLDTDVTLTIYDGSGEKMALSQAYSSYEESPFHTGYAERTGVNLEWSKLPEGADTVTAFNMLQQESEMPNVMLFFTHHEYAEPLLNNGRIYDLTDYLPTYAPDYWAYITDPSRKDALRSTMTDDGRIYCFEFFRESPFGSVYCGPVIRQDWLDENGLEMPVTLADWENVLTVFHDKYGAVFTTALGTFNKGGLASGVDAFASLNSHLYVDGNEKVQLGNAQPEWKEYLEILHRWYENGLLDPDFTTASSTDYRAKAANNETGIIFTAIGQIPVLNKEAEDNQTGANWVGLSYPRTEPGSTTHYIQGSRMLMESGSGAMISTSCSEEQLIAAIEMLNWNYTEEGIKYMNYGIEGESYYVDDNGVIQLTDLILNDSLGQTEAMKKYTCMSTGVAGIQTDHYLELKNGQAASDAVNIWIENTDYAKYYVPAVSFSEDSLEVVNDLFNTLDSYISEMALRFITGEESLDNFDQFVASLDGMGLQDYLEIYQDAYDIYLTKG